MKKICILKSVTVLAVIIMSIGLLTGCEMKFGNKDEKNKTEAYEEPVKNLIEGLAEANSEKFLNAFPPFISNNEYMKNTFTNEYLQGVLEKAQEDYGANITMSFKVTNKEEISEENIKNKEEDIKSYYNEEVTITKGYKLNTEITTKGDNEEDTDIGEFEVYEIEGKWYIIDF
nr:hypothetical protein [Clostridia bacterium]